MNKATLLATAVAATALIATPVLAQDAARPATSAHMKMHRAEHHASMHHARHHAHMMRSGHHVARRDELAGDWNGRNSGFWPADVAGGIVGGAIGTAGAIATGAVDTAGTIATAPFGGPGYYENGRYARGRMYGDAGPGYRYGNTYASTDVGNWNEPYVDYRYDGNAIPGSPNYDARNGFYCRPGTLTKMPNGDRTICQ